MADFLRVDNVVEVWVVHRDAYYQPVSVHNSISVAGLKPYGTYNHQSEDWRHDKRLRKGQSKQFEKFSCLPPNQPHKVKLIFDKYFI